MNLLINLLSTKHAYISVGYTREILMCCISTVEERTEECVISCEVKT